MRDEGQGSGPLKLVVGLGNPGPSYADTRHNVGFRITQHFAQRCDISLEEQRFFGRFGRGSLKGSAGLSIDVGILQPETFMNRSGQSVLAAVQELGIEDFGRDLLIAIDDVDLAFGRLRLRARGGAGGHRGLADIIDCLAEFDLAALPRLRFGVGRPDAGGDTAAYVLEPFSLLEEAQLPDHLERCSEALDAALREGIDAAMTRFNRDPDTAPEADTAKA